MFMSQLTRLGASNDKVYFRSGQVNTSNWVGSLFMEINKDVVIHNRVLSCGSEYD